MGATNTSDDGGPQQVRVGGGSGGIGSGKGKRESMVKEFYQLREKD